MTAGDGIAVVGIAGAIAGLASVWIVASAWCRIEAAKLTNGRKR